MIICAKCRKEMSCKKTGSYIRFRGGTHVYPADQFECKKCGAIINVGNGNCYFDSTCKANEYDVIMDEN
jgi:hypothetical protein